VSTYLGAQAAHPFPDRTRRLPVLLGGGKVDYLGLGTAMDLIALLSSGIATLKQCMGRDLIA
jgi:hypothetical protein